MTTKISQSALKFRSSKASWVTISRFLIKLVCFMVAGGALIRRLRDSQSQHAASGAWSHSTTHPHRHTHTWRSNWPHALIASCSSSGQCSCSFGTAAVYRDTTLHMLLNDWLLLQWDEYFIESFSLIVITMLFISVSSFKARHKRRVLGQNFIMNKGDKHYIDRWPNCEFSWHWI